MHGPRLFRRLAAAVLTLPGLLGPAGPGHAAPPSPPAVAAEHPSSFFMKAAEAYGASRHREATFWLYVAQLRYRAFLRSHPDLDPSGDPALFASMMETIGRPINEQAWGDVAEALAAIDRALRWDEEHPDASLPEDIRRSTREGLVAFRDDMAGRVEEIRRERLANGLENR
jgi:hypothetical protein